MRAHLCLPGITVHFSLKQQSASPRGIHGGDVDSRASALLTTQPSASAGLQVLCPAPSSPLSQQRGPKMTLSSLYFKII